MAAGRDVVHPGLSDGRDGIESYAAGSLKLRPASNELNGRFHVWDAHVVEHDDVGACFEGFSDLIEAITLHFDLGKRRHLRLGETHGLRDIATYGNMIVLEHHPVAETQATMESSAAGGGMFLEHS